MAVIRPVPNETPQGMQVKQFLNKIRDIILLASITTFVIIGLVPISVTAQNLCDQLIVDDARVFDNHTSEVEAAARKLISRGADVRVRTITTFGSAGNLDRFEAQLEQQ